MNFLQTLRVALRAILRNKLRAFLTTLGIVIGVGAVIAMMAIGAGAKARVEQAFAAMGTNLLIIQSGSSSQGGVQGGFGSQPTLTWDDFAAISAEVPSIKRAAPMLRATLAVISEDQNWTTSVTGTSPDYFDIRSWPIDLGVPFTQQDLDGGAKVVVLGATVVEKLYGANANPIGLTLRIGSIPFQIVGVAGRKGQSATGQDYDDAAFIPYTTFAQKVQGGLGKYLRGSIMASAESADGTVRAQKDISVLLRERHHLSRSDDDDFQLRNLSEIASAQQAGTDTMTTLLASVAAVSLFVGGIGIMNIMLVSVTERTREIGIRMAVGAKPSHILAQFLIEALSLSTAGGLIGVGIGVGVAVWLAGRFHWRVRSVSGAEGVAAGSDRRAPVRMSPAPRRAARPPARTTRA